METLKLISEEIQDVSKKYRVSNKDIMKYFEKEVLTIG